MKLAQISDLHILDLAGVRWTRFLNKRVTGLMNLVGSRKDAHPVALAERLVKTLVDLVDGGRVDHVVVTGDLTNLALESELAAARRILAPLAGRLSVIPGNHDVYTRGAERARRFEQVFGDWMWQAGEAHDYPWVKRVGLDERVSLVGFGSAVARLPFIATGLVAEAQLERLGALRPRLAGTFPVALVHHNLHPRGWRKDRMHGLENRDAFLAACADAGVRLVLHGHTHVAHRMEQHGIAVVGSGSSTWSSPHPAHAARFNVYDITDGQLAGIEVHRHDAATDTFVPVAAESPQATT